MTGKFVKGAWVEEPIAINVSYEEDMTPEEEVAYAYQYDIYAYPRNEAFVGGGAGGDGSMSREEECDIPYEDRVYLAGGSTRPLATLTRADCAMLYGEPDAPYLDQAHHTWLCERCEFPKRLEMQNREWRFVMALLAVWVVLFILFVAFN